MILNYTFVYLTIVMQSVVGPHTKVNILRKWENSN